jgi:teichoic acid transport system permease protein
VTEPSSAGSALAEEWGIPRLGARPPLGAYLRKLVNRRHFTWELSRSRFRAENEQYRLGILWVVLKPLLQALVYGTVFGLILNASPSKPDNYVPYMLTGVFVFAFFSGCFSDGSKSIVSSMGLMRTLHFPRVILPLSKVLQNAMAMIPTMGVLGVLIVITGEVPSWDWLEVIPAMFLMFFFCLGVAMIAARLTLHARDVTNLVPFINRLVFYASGIFFSVSQLGIKNPVLEALLIYNPTHVYIALVRHAMLENPEEYNFPAMWLMAGVWAVVVCIAGFLYFWQAEERYGRT